MTFDWNAVWQRKADTQSDDALEISGFEHFRSIDTENAAKKLIELLAIKPTDRVLELGCAAGLLGRHLQHYCHYVGTDRSENMVKKTIALNGFSAVSCAADDIVFKDRTFHKVFAFSVFQYFPDYEYANRVIVEMKRVAIDSICVSDIPLESLTDTHLLYDHKFFHGWELSGPLYQREKRYTAVLRL